MIGGNNASPSGACSGACNLVSGNDDSGVRIEGEGTMSNTVSGNYIGTNVTGTVCIYNNQNEAVRLRDGASYSLIGGDTPAERNLLGCEGLTIGHPWSSGSVHNRIINNYLGVDPTDSYQLVGAVWQGILFWEDRSHSKIISNTVRGFIGQGIGLKGVEWILIRGNTISNNGSDSWSPDGIVVGMYGDPASEVTISRNSIYSNTEKGIRLKDGANGGIQPPGVVYTNAVTGVASGAACTGCRVEVFSDNEDEGRWYEGVVTATITGTWSFSKGSSFVGPHIHATETDAMGNTSELSFGTHWIFLPLVVRQ